MDFALSSKLVLWASVRADIRSLRHRSSEVHQWRSIASDATCHPQWVCSGANLLCEWSKRLHQGDLANSKQAFYANEYFTEPSRAFLVRSPIFSTSLKLVPHRAQWTAKRVFLPDLLLSTDFGQYWEINHHFLLQFSSILLASYCEPQ